MVNLVKEIVWDRGRGWIQSMARCRSVGGRAIMVVALELLVNAGFSARRWKGNEDRRNQKKGGNRHGEPRVAQTATALAYSPHALHPTSRSDSTS